MAGNPTESCLLFIDKYRPSSFEELRFNQTVAQKIMASAKSHEMPHIIIKGPSGCGKKTFADFYIQSKYDKDKLVTKPQKLDIKHASKTIELQLLYSQYHYKIDPSAHGVYDRLIIQGFIKDMLQTRPISPTIPYHIIIIENADRLTLEAQQSLRRTLEKYIDNCRFIFLISQESSLIDPLMSRCALFRLAAPTHEEIITHLKHICSNERIPAIDSQLQQISTYSQRSLSTAVNLLQQIWTEVPKALTETSILRFRDLIEIDQYLDQIMTLLFGKRSPKTILQIRALLFDLLVHCEDPLEILKRLFQLVFKRVNDAEKHEVIQALVKYENTLKQGSKPIYHLEGFVVTVLNLL